MGSKNVAKISARHRNATQDMGRLNLWRPMSVTPARQRLERALRALRARLTFEGVDAGFFEEGADVGETDADGDVVGGHLADVDVVLRILEGAHLPDVLI